MESGDDPLNNPTTRTVDLTQWGAGAANLESVPGLGRVTRVERGECDVITERGWVRALSDSTRAQGQFAPATGDWVRVERRGDLALVIAEVLPRGKTLARRDPGEQGITQVLVANVDTVFIVHGMDRPLPPGRIERCLVIVWASGAQPVVVLSKLDVASGDGEIEATVRAVAPGVPVAAISAERGIGMGELAGWLRPGTTTALLGESGAGKSTLVNAMLGHAAQATAEVRQHDAKGRHTTITRDLLLLPSGALVVDTPGIRAVGLVGGGDALAIVFADIEDLAERCRFHDCVHGDEPGCAVRSGVEAGRLDPRRLGRYRLMAAELDEQTDRDAERARRSNRRR